MYAIEVKSIDASIIILQRVDSNKLGIMKQDLNAKTARDYAIISSTPQVVINLIDEKINALLDR